MPYKRAGKITINRKTLLLLEYYREGGETWDEFIKELLRHALAYNGNTLPEEDINNSTSY